MKTYWFVRSFLTGEICSRKGKLVRVRGRNYIEVGSGGTTSWFVLGREAFESEQDAANLLLASYDQKIDDLLDLVREFELRKSAIVANLTGDLLGS